VLATLIRLLGDFDLAEEAMQEAFTAALRAWQDGVPARPRAWLISTGRFRIIDQLRRRARFDASAGLIAEHLGQQRDNVAPDDLDLPDDQLRLIFTCCHPALSLEAQVALTLREICGLQTEAIAHAYLVPASTLAQRIVRAKAKIRDAGIPYQVPAGHQLTERLGGVLHVVYLVFNAGYSPAAAPLGDADFSGDAIRLGRLLVDLLPTAETLGLLALMLLHDARRAARIDSNGEIVLLADQDRTRWDAERIAEGSALVDAALRNGTAGPYTIQAAIAALHCAASTAGATDWAEIAALYDLLLEIHDTPVVALNRAVAVAMCAGPSAGLALIDQLLAGAELQGYHLAHAARADLCRQLGQTAEALSAYRTAMALVAEGPERRFLARRIAELSPSGTKHG
jgi:RNA polymerase sigma-70 factor (ECF subfamily)